MASKAQQKAVVNNTAAAAAGGIGAAFVNGAAQSFLPAEFAQFNGAIPLAVGVLLQLQKSKASQNIGLGMAAVGASSLLGQVINGLGVGSPALRVNPSQVR